MLAGGVLAALLAGCGVMPAAPPPGRPNVAHDTGAPGKAQPAAERVLVPVRGLSSSPAPLVAWLFVPAGQGPHPAVVMLHGCGGAYARDGRLNARHRMWGEFLAAHGYAALLVDSFTSRGVREICTVPFHARTLRESDRVGDAYAALVWLRGHPGIDPARIALLGWSHGGGVTLAAIARVPTGLEGFDAAIAFYPGCTMRNRHAATYHPTAPTLVLMGESDDWTPAAPCRSLVSKVAARGEPMTIVTWPGTYHDFDNPALRHEHVRHDVPNGVHAGRGVTTAPNPAAREEAKRRVLAFLAGARR